jgi:hypothetical protein
MTTATPESAQATLTQATLARDGGTDIPRPAAAELQTALLTTEKSAKRDKVAIPMASLLGEWRLCYAVGAKKSGQKRGIKLGKGYYFPKFIFAAITFTETEISNRACLGSLQLKFTGPCRFSPRKNLLIFDFTHIDIQLFGRTLYRGQIRRKKYAAQSFADTPVAQLPFFAFFWASPDGIAARGRGGGVALWVKADKDNGG